MAVDTRRCFWFGTEERMVMFATPLQGAESSPEGWSADGTLLNGGAYGLHSWGSHKRYTYEWPQSSSPETAQMMKSYRDGTYGRGLLYFLEPGIYRTNVLPAHWADPSMSLDNEAPSLVYNVDPTPVATSGGSTNNLPVTSAHYNLTGNPQTQPSLESSVFIPVPEGHTLFLGAFYSSTGTGGVYATPVNSNGTYGTAVKLTELANNSTQIVTETFSDIRGVRLWVGRTTSATSTVTLTAMTGRILQTSDVPVYSPWLETYRNLRQSPNTFNPVVGTMTEAVEWNGVEWTQMESTGNATTRQTVPLASLVSGASYTYIVEVGNPGTSPISITVDWCDVPGTGPVNVPAGSRVIIRSPGARAYDSTFRFGDVRGGTGQTFLVRLGTVLSGVVLSAPAFDGDTLAEGELERTRWLGVVGASDSVLETRTRSGSPDKQTRLSAGPWIGGQGHSGCRFLGTPSYVTNSPIEGGRVGFAASFVEVGSWVYG